MIPSSRRARTRRCRGGGIDLRALPGEHPQAHAAGRQGLHSVDQVGKVATEAVELPDDEHVARSARAHAAVESRAVVAGTGREVVVDVDGVDARGLQRIARQVLRLGAVRLGDARISWVLLVAWIAWVCSLALVLGSHFSSTQAMRTAVAQVDSGRASWRGEPLFS